jgi:hypothetical protein
VTGRLTYASLYSAITSPAGTVGTGAAAVGAVKLVMMTRPCTSSVSSLAVIVSMPAPTTRMRFPSTRATVGLDEKKSK